MVRILLGSFLLGLALYGCDKKEHDDYAGPVWILNVTVRDGSRPDQQMQHCARVIWNYQSQTDTHEAQCRNTNGFVKVYEGISEDVRIYYHVECEDYGPSPESFADFPIALLDSTTDSGNPEVVVNREVLLFPN